jgi:hypothetical protein
MSLVTSAENSFPLENYEKKIFESLPQSLNKYRHSGGGSTLAKLSVSNQFWVRIAYR